MLFAYPILDSTSYVLDEYIRRAAHDLDEAAGSYFTIIYIGDPEQCGTIHRSLRSKRLASSDEREARHYIEHVHKAGREQHHRLGEMKDLARRFGLTSRNIPCIVFIGETGEQPLRVLHLRSSWYDCSTSLRVFDRRFRLWLKRQDVRKMAASDSLGPRRSRLLGSLLQKLVADIQMHIDMEGAGVRMPKRPVPKDGTAALCVDAGTCEVLYKGLAVHLTRTPARLLGALAQSTGQWVPYEKLQSLARIRAYEDFSSPSKWAKDHKLALMKGLRQLVGQKRIKETEIKRLVTARNGHMILNLPREQVLLK